MPSQKNLIDKINKPDFYVKLIDIYEDTAVVEHQRSRYEAAIKTHKDLYGQQDCFIFSAPGRTEICGNHTDHQHGKVLAGAVNLDAIAVVCPSKDNTITIYSEGYGEINANLDVLEPNTEEYGSSQALIKGVCAALKNQGYKIGGFKAYVTSEVADGAGISSSAAFEVLIGTILSGLYNNMKIDPVTIAIAGKHAECDFFGKPCGLMDQMACSVGGIINIDFKNETNPILKKVNFDFGKSGYGLCITVTESSHANLTEHYAAIPNEMVSVAHAMGKDLLRECSETEFSKNFATIRKKVGDRAILRALHFFMEEHNVDNAVAALENGDINQFLQVIKTSGESSAANLQNIFTAGSVKDQCIQVAITTSDYILGNNGVTRVHGGGFAGTIQAFVKLDAIVDYKNQMENTFKQGTTHNLRIRKYGGIRVL